MRRAEKYQIALIVLGAVCALLFSAFLWRELYPEYKIYQDDYIVLEQFRSTYTGQPPPQFKKGVKQILIEKGGGPPEIDRCTSCHVALQFSHFSPTKIARDINGNIIRETDGNPVQIPNEDYVWGRLDQKILELVDDQKNQQLTQEGKTSLVKQRLAQAREYESLKQVRVGNLTYDVTKVLSMHPLIGKETRPFEFHPIDSFGCVSCHNGNGRGLTTEKAHGPVFDGEYGVEFMGPKPQFVELDPENDPKFARMFNDKPGSHSLFQTTPIFTGALIQAKCVQCHQSSLETIRSSLGGTSDVVQQHQKRSQAIQNAYEKEKDAFVAILGLKINIEKEGITAAFDQLEKRSKDYSLPTQTIEQTASQLQTLKSKILTMDENAQKRLLDDLELNMEQMLGTKEQVQQFESIAQETLTKGDSVGFALDEYIKQRLQNDPNDKNGTLILKAAAWNLQETLAAHVKETETSLEKSVADRSLMENVKTDIDVLTNNYKKGEELYISQACYACHRISSLARGGVGPELTQIGNSYPWYVKESMVWPQADLHTSTMPNPRLDHEELENLMTFLLAQTGKRKIQSDISYKVAVQEWEKGKKSEWEKPIQPNQIYDLDYSRTVFATEGCAACHRLVGFESNTGFAIEKETPNDEQGLLKEKQWFANLVPESITAKSLVSAIEQHAHEIDKRIVDDVRSDSILEKIEKEHPGLIESFYTRFKFASRAKDHFYQTKIAQENDAKRKVLLEQERKEWKERVAKVLKIYIQEYGLGKLICPRPNWAGVYRSDQWLMEHFKNPSGHVARSLMPVFPFDDTKFHALTYMLDVLSVRNRDAIHKQWALNGFQPEQAYQLFCAQCHGEFLGGNGEVAEWIYPIPKNLRNSDFLKNLTKERVINSIIHGINGTPMPPWGEIGGDKHVENNTPIINEEQARELTEWIFSLLPSEPGKATDVPKWQYSPGDVLEEIKRETNVSNISDVFDMQQNPNDDVDTNAYFIKKKLYTKKNLELGQHYFELNCAPCHGKEADGSGIRSSVMDDAKPRMLTNLNWIDTRDDLRLLRSIKYGVPGTSMTPWGDQTSSLQRLQLVMYIRSLTQDRQKRENLLSIIYETFEPSKIAIERARVEKDDSLEASQQEYVDIQRKRSSLQANIHNDANASKEAAELYQKELELLIKIKRKKQIDELYAQLKGLLQKEQDLYTNLGFNLLSKDLDQETLNLYLELIKSNKQRFSFTDNKLHINLEDNELHKNALQKELLKSIDARLDVAKQQQSLVASRFSSPEKQQSFNEYQAEINTLVKLRRELISDLEETKRLSEQQKMIFEQLNNELKNG